MLIRASVPRTWPSVGPQHRLQLGFWAVVFALKQAPGVFTTVLLGPPLLTYNALYVGAGLVASSGCLRLWLRPRVPGGSIPRWRWVGSALLVAVAVLVPGALMTFVDARGPDPGGADPAELVWWYVLLRGEDALVVATAWCLAQAAWVGAARAAQAERGRLTARLDAERAATLASEARLTALQGRVNPHFLFNAMNTIRALITDQPEVARDAVTKLAFLMRRTLSAAEQPEHPLADELAIVEAYLALETLRFGDRLRGRVRVEAGVDGLVVPPLAIQTLVENAVKHGVGRQLTAVDVQVEVRPEPPAAVAIEVANTGALGSTDGGGRGLGLLRERMALLYGPTAVVSLEARDGRVLAALRWTPRRPGAARP